MTLFLFVKQIVDMLYQYRMLDYLMVIWVLLLLCYQTALVRPDFKEKITVADGIVLALCVLLTVNFLRTRGGYQIYFKVLSAFLMYFVGRIYYDRVKECYGALVTASYLIVFISFLERIYRFGFSLGKVRDAGGGFYFYDTDMAFAMILAMVFIAMMGKNSVLKLITVFGICPYMVFCSDAGIQAMLMLTVYIIMTIYVMEAVLRKKKVFDSLLSMVIVGLVGLVIFLYLPVFGIDNAVLLENMFQSRFLNNGNMNARYAAWKEVIAVMEGGSVIQNMFGRGMGEELVIDSLYIKIYYALGVTGLILAGMLITSVMYYVTKVRDRKTFYLMVIMAVMLLGTGVTVNSMESTQMSWFPFLFAGMVVSSVREEKEENRQEEAL